MKLNTLLNYFFIYILTSPFCIQSSYGENSNKNSLDSKSDSKNFQLASASAYSNTLGRANSLKKVVEKLITESLKEKDLFTLNAQPNISLTDYKDRDYCKQKLEETAKNPYTFKEIKFEEMDDFNDWFSDFSQGDGDEGRLLYKKCDKSCSPSYSILIKRNQDKTFVVIPNATCGEARDKDDNQYKVWISK